MKVEPPTGDAIRMIGTPPVTPKRVPGHRRLNQGKRSVVWDLTSSEGKIALHKLIEQRKTRRKRKWHQSKNCRIRRPKIREKNPLATVFCVSSEWASSFSEDVM